MIQCVISVLVDCFFDKRGCQPQIEPRSNAVLAHTLCIYCILYSIYTQLLTDDQCAGVRNGSVLMRLE